RCLLLSSRFFFFFCNAPAASEIYTLSLHDALPISCAGMPGAVRPGDALLFAVPVARQPTDAGAARARACARLVPVAPVPRGSRADRKSTRLNSSHLVISYAVFCLKKKKNIESTTSH